MYGLSVNTYFVRPNWNPYGPVPAVSGSLGGVGAPSLPVPPGSKPLLFLGARRSAARPGPAGDGARAREGERSP